MAKKICSMCNTEKDLSEFYACSRSLKCKECDKKRKKFYRKNDPRYRITANKRMREKREFLSKCKNNPCKDCGQSFLPCQMDFDHRDPGTKVDNVSRLASNDMAIKHVIAEIAKCDLVCANCHRLREYNRSLSPLES